MKTINEYLEKRLNLYEKCYNSYERVIDIITNEIILLPVQRKGQNEDLVEKNVNPCDIEFKNFIVGKYLKFRDENKFKTFYYKVVDIKIGGVCSIPTFEMFRLNVNFTEEKKPTIKRISSDYCIVSEIEIISETKWAPKNNFPFMYKNLYILQNEIGRIKIGVSTNVDDRLKAIKMQSGMDTKVLRVIPFNANLEWQLHLHFRAKRYIGEWFNLDKEDINFLLYEDLDSVFKKKISANSSKRKHDLLERKDKLYNHYSSH